MLNSLTLESRKLIEQLSSRTCPDFQSSRKEKPTNDLLFNCDNIRQKNTEISTNTHDISESYPKSSVTSILSRSAVLSKSMPKRIPFGLPNKLSGINEDSDLKVLKNSDLLGYDWIAAMLEIKPNESQLDKPLDYFDELDRFRRKNKQFCMSTENKSSCNKLSSKDFEKKIEYTIERPCYETSTAEESPHVYAYTLNERLFPVALDFETAERDLSNVQNSHIIKISIPSNRFLHRSQGLGNTRDNRSLPFRPNESLKNFGESLSLSSHCQESINNTTISCNEKLSKKKSFSRQKAAGLIGNLIPDVLDFSENKYNMLPFGKNQPKTEEEALQQLRRGKTANLHRTIPSSLENRTFNIDSVQIPSNISQTRIVLKELADDSVPRKINLTDSKLRPPTDISRDIIGNIPRPSASRKEMSKRYVDAIEKVAQ